MTTIKNEITDVKGIGPATAGILAQHGIKTVRALATASLSKLMTIPGFNEFRAGQVNFNARSLLKKLEASKGTGHASTAKAKPVSKQADVSSVAKEQQQSEIIEKNKKDKKKSKAEEEDKSKKKDKKKAKSKDTSAKKNKK